MPDPGQLPHLLKLLDDDSEVVRQAVIRQLFSFGAGLEDELNRLPDPPGDRQRQLLAGLLAPHYRDGLRADWPGWKKLPEDKARLEAAFDLLARFQGGISYRTRLRTRLDGLARESQSANLHADVFKLAHFLFEIKQFKGAVRDYYDPRHSDLVYVIQHHRGLPISLACLYMLVGHRLGLEIEGCNFPGHFLARVVTNGSTFLIDCFNGGAVLNEESVVSMSAETHRATRAIIQNPACAAVIIDRVLRNLQTAYQKAGQLENAQLMLDLQDNSEPA